MNKGIGLVLTLCSLLVVAGADEAHAAAGQFQFVAGEVKVVNRAGVERMARKGMDVDEGDTVSTIAGASAQIRMVDGGFIAVRPDSRLKVETFVYNGKQDGQERSLILLLKGGFRAITGLIGNLNKQNYLIRTPTATIGIRGTDHEPMFIPQPLPGVAAIGVPGTYDKVNHGAAFIKTDLGIIHIDPNQVGFVAGADKIPQLLPKIPEFYKPAPEKFILNEKPDANELQRKDSKSGGLSDTKSLKGGRPTLEGRAGPSATLAEPTATLKTAPTSKTLIAPTTLLIAPTTLTAPTTATTSSTTLIAPTTTTISTTLIAPTTTTSTTTLIAPTTTTTSTTTLIAPTTSTTTLIAPMTSTSTLIAPTTSTTTLVAPTTSMTTLIAPTTSTTTLIAPTTSTTTLIAPTTTLTSPTTTLIAPITTTIKLAP